MEHQSREIINQVPWKCVIGIVLAGVIISLSIILFSIFDNDHTSDSTSNTPVYTVTFLNHNGEILEEQQVHAGSFVQPPQVASTNDAIVFRGWSQKLYNINRSTEMTPVFQDLRQERNAFYMDSQCVQLGAEVESNLWLGGTVCLSSVQLVLKYDSEVLLEMECNTAGSPFVVVSEEPGTVILELDEEENLTKPVAIADIHFRIAPNREDLASTRIHIEMKDPAMMTERGEAGSNSCAVHGDIYLLS